MVDCDTPAAAAASVWFSRASQRQRFRSSPSRLIDMIDIYQPATTCATRSPPAVDIRRAMTTLADQLRAIRTAAGLTQIELAAKIGLSQPTVSGAERGTPTTSDAIERWATACGARVVVTTESAGAVLAAAAGLDAADLLRLERIARALRGTPAETKDAIVIALETLSAR